MGNTLETSPFGASLPHIMIWRLVWDFTFWSISQEECVSKTCYEADARGVYSVQRLLMRSLRREISFRQGRALSKGFNIGRNRRRNQNKLKHRPHISFESSTPILFSIYCSSNARSNRESRRAVTTREPEDESQCSAKCTVTLENSTI